jgi:hypothetical protein
MRRLTQENLNRWHKKLDQIIAETEKAVTECCLENETEARDKLTRVQAHLLFARAEAGGLSIRGGEIKPLSGEK